MKKSLVCLGLVLLLVAAFAVAASAAAPKLAGNWYINGKRVVPSDQPGGFAQPLPPNMPLTIYTTDDPTLFYGTLVGPEGDQNFMTIMMDAGANMHFTVSRYAPNQTSGPLHTCTTGRGTASTTKINGLWSDDVGITGNFIMTRSPQ